MFLSLSDTGSGFLFEIPGNSFVTFSRANQPALVTESGDGKFVIFLSDGDLARFHGFECSDNNHWFGSFVTQIEIEVDLDSYSSEETNKFGQVKIHKGKSYLLMNIHDGGVRQGTWIAIGTSPLAGSQPAYFSSWRIVRRVQEQVEVLFEQFGQESTVAFSD